MASYDLIVVGGFSGIASAISASSSIEDNGVSSYTNSKGETVTGNKGTFGGWFNDIY